MTAAAAGALPPRLRAVPAATSFRRVPSSAGRGEMLLAGLPGGCLVIAPPWAALDRREGRLTRTRWRYGWFAADQDGPDLDARPDEQAPVPFDALWEIGRLSEHAPFLRAQFVARARHFTRMSQRLAGEHREIAVREVAAMREEWARAFPHDAWPLGDEPQAAQRPCLRDVAGAALSWLVPIFRTEAGALGIHGLSDRRSTEPKTVRRFGPHVVLSVEPAGDATLHVDFDGLSRTHPELAAGMVMAYVVLGDEEQTVAAEARFEIPKGPRRAPIALPPEALADAGAWIALLPAKRP